MRPSSQPDNSKRVFRRKLRLWSFTLGVIILLWLPVEDLSARWTLLFAAFIACLAAAWVWATLSGQASSPWLLPVAGLAGGAAVTPLALLLMAFKSGLHGHGQLDFTPGQVSAVLERWPVWIIAGVLLGSGIAIWIVLKRE